MNCLTLRKLTELTETLGNFEISPNSTTMFHSKLCSRYLHKIWRRDYQKEQKSGEKCGIRAFRVFFSFHPPSPESFIMPPTEDQSEEGRKRTKKLSRGKNSSARENWETMTSFRRVHFMYEYTCSLRPFLRRVDGQVLDEEEASRYQRFSSRRLINRIDFVFPPNRSIHQILIDVADDVILTHIVRRTIKQDGEAVIVTAAGQPWLSLWYYWSKCYQLFNGNNTIQGFPNTYSMV